MSATGTDGDIGGLRTRRYAWFNDRVRPIEDPHTAAIRTYMTRRWPDARRMRTHVMEVWAEYRTLDVDELDQVVTQLTNDDHEQFWQRLWEMQLGSHLLRLGHRTRSPAKGPDFRFEADGITVWVEAVSPAPRGIPDAWFAFPETGAGTSYETPNVEMLLRWTAAFREKRRKFEGYAREGITGPGDACVIAINGGQLSGFWPTPHGVSQMPWAVEVVFPVGPRYAEFFRGTDEVRWGQSERHEVSNRNGATVGLYPFITPECAGISALVTCVDGCPSEGGLQLYIAHNPVAAVPIPTGLFGNAAEEWEAVQVNGVSGEFSLRQLRRAAP